MSTICGRCKEKEAAFECADCASSKRRGELLPLCDACNELIHVGFLADHQTISVTVKEQKRLFEEQLKLFKNQGKHLQLKLNEISYARHDIEQRAQYKQQGVSQALQTLWQALKQKEKELTALLRDESREKSTLLAEWERHINLANKDFQSVCSDAQKLLQGDLMKFAENHEEIQKKMEKFEVGALETPFPTLGQPTCLDVTQLLHRIKELSLKSDDSGDKAVMAKAGEEKREDSFPSGETDSITPELQSPKQGDILQVYVESRLDPKGRFWVSRNLNENVANMYENLSFRIREDIVKSPLTQVEVTEGMLCCSQFQEDHRWYRGRVEQLKKDKGLVRVRWLDYAHDNDVPLAAVQPLKEEFQKLPFQALEFCLFDDLEEDLPHQARWEFSDHTANVVLNCEILKQMLPSSGGDKGLVYLVDLKNPHKETDIKGAVMEKAEEARCKKDTIMCRDIRYMKDYVPPGGKATGGTVKDTTPEKAKEAKQQKKQAKDLPEAAKTETGKNKEVAKDAIPEKLTVEAKDQTEASQGVTGCDKDSAKTQKGGEEGGGDGGHETGMEQEKGSGQVANKDGVENSVAAESSAKPCEGDSMKNSQNGCTEAGKHATQDTDSAAKPINSDVDVSKMEEEAASPKDADCRRPDETVESKEVPSRRPGDGFPETQKMTEDVNSQAKVPTNDDSAPSSDLNGQMSGSQPSKAKSDGNQDSSHAKKTTSDPNVYSIEDEEEGDDQSLVERLAVQSNWVMANSPDNACGVGSSAGTTYQPYSSMGFYMTGVNKPPLALGLNPIGSAGDTNSTNMVDMSKPGSGSFTGDGFKIAVDSSFSIYVATPLSDTGRFWASRLRGPAQESQLRRLMHDISMPFETLTLEKLKEIKVVCAQSEAGLWCRARVEGFVDDKVRVRYVDFGQAEVVEVQRVKTLPATHQLFPYQALELSLATKEHPRFSQQAKDAFSQYTQGRTLTAKVLATEAKCVCVSLTCVDDKQLVYDISSAVLNINVETRTRHPEDKAKDQHSPSEHGQNEGPGTEDHRTYEGHDGRYDYQSDGRSHDRGSGDRCFVCYNFGHLSYDCPMKKGDSRDRRNKGGSKKGQGWGRRNRKY